MIYKTFYVTNIIYVDEDNSTYRADNVQGLDDDLVIHVNVNKGASNLDIEFEIKLEIDRYLVAIGRGDYQAYQFTYQEE